MANINSNQTVALSTVVTGGLQPYDQCARWAGGWTANNGTTGILGVGPVVPTFTPYIDSNNTPCAIPGTDGGSLTGTLMPNGFTGSISVWVDVADSSGIFKESNTKSYTVLPVTALIVNAGPDYALSGPGPHYFSVGGATASGGTPPYTYLWTQTYPGNPERSFFTPGIPISGPFTRNQSTALLPDLEEFTSNGTYNFQLTATDSSGQTGTDSMQVVVTGATPPPLGPSLDQITYEFILYDPGNVTGNFQITRNGGMVVQGFNSAVGSVNGFSSGDLISGSASGSALDLFVDVSVTWEIRRQSRTAPYPTTIIATYSNCNSATATVNSANWTFNPAFQYQILCNSGTC
jgi:hypothetical protein